MSLIQLIRQRALHRDPAVMRDLSAADRFCARSPLPIRQRLIHLVHGRVNRVPRHAAVRTVAMEDSHRRPIHAGHAQQRLVDVRRSRRGNPACVIDLVSIVPREARADRGGPRSASCFLSRAEVDLITHHRNPQRGLAAIYLVMPTSQNVELILRDYNPNPVPPQNGKSAKKGVPVAPQEPPKYAAAHINFMDGARSPSEAAVCLLLVEALTGQVDTAQESTMR